MKNDELEVYDMRTGTFFYSSTCSALICSLQFLVMAITYNNNCKISWPTRTLPVKDLGNISPAVSGDQI